MVSLSELPDEILLLILSNLDFDQPSKIFSSLCLLNKNLSTIAQPFVFRSVSIIFGFGPRFKGFVDQPKSLLLHRSLSETPALRNHVRRLEITFMAPFHVYDETTEADIPILEEAKNKSKEWIVLYELIEWMTSVRYLVLHKSTALATIYVDFGWELFAHLLKSMPNLEHLHLIDLTTQIETRTLVQMLRSFTKLKMLCLDCTGPSSDPARKLGINYTADCNLASLYELSLECSSQWPEGMEYRPLLPYCSNLSSLKWINLAKTGRSFKLPAPSVQEVLTPVMSTLCELTLSCTGRNYGREFRPSVQQMCISRLPRLRKLNLLNWVVERFDNPSDVYESFFAGSLRALEWRFYEESCNVNETAPKSMLLETLGQVIEDSFRYAEQHGSRLSTLKLEAVIDNHPTGVLSQYDVPRLEKKMERFQAELLDRGIAADCSVSVAASESSNYETDGQHDFA
jgi:hypothetical protein